MAKDIRVALELDNRQFNRGLDKSKREVQSFGQTSSRVGGIVAGLVSVAAIKSVVDFGDRITNLKNKLLTLNPSAEAVNEQFQRIKQIAVDSRSDLDGVGDLYFRIARAQDELGISSEQTATIVESVSKAITASGLSAQEAQGPLLQLGQALQSGRFQGDELRSILEGLPDVARALAKSLGVPIGQLKELGSQGLITGEVFVDAMAQAKDSIDEAFGRTDVTVGQGLQLISTSFASLVETFGKETGAFTSVAESLEKIAEFVQNLADSTDAMKNFGLAIVSIIGSFLLLRGSFNIINGGFKDLSRSALLSVKGQGEFLKSLKGVAVGTTNAIMRLVGLKDVGKASVTIFGRLSIAARGLVGLLGGPLGLGAAVASVIFALRGLEDVDQIDLVKKISKDGKEATIKAIEAIRIEIEELKKAQDDLTGSFLLDIMNIRESNKEIALLEERIRLLYKQIDDGFVGPPLPKAIAEAREQQKLLEEAANKSKKAILDFMLSIGKEERTPEAFTEALAKLNELFADAKTNEQILEYEKNLRTLYRTFGEKMPKDELTPFEELNKAVGEVTNLQQYNTVLGQIVEQAKLLGINAGQSEELIEKLNEKISKSERIFMVFQDAISSAGMSLGDDLANALVEGESALDSFKNFFKETVKQVIAEAIRLTIVRALINSIFGAFGFDVTFGASSDIASVKKRASGGPVMNNKPYIVGENGPELFVPNNNGSIIPNNRMGGGSTSVTYNIQAVDAPSFQALIARDPDFIHAVASKGANNLPSGRRF